jgi:predicted helicase
MPATLPRHIAAYYDALKDLNARNATSEGAVRIAFQNVLDDAGRPRGLRVVGEQTIHVGRRKRIRVDGEVRDAFNIRFGVWEAKDTADDLDTEIRKKIEAGYPTRNTIFENTERAVLVQHGTRRDFDLRDPVELQALLDRFYAFTEPRIDEFHTAVDEFADQIPQLAQALKAIIDREKRDNKKFRQALNDFHELCRASLNPATTEEEVEDMLRQHLLTERIFTSVFRNRDFVLQNPIARELEKVIGALRSRVFSREEFLGKLDHFYHAIETTAATIDSYTEKQEFLHKVYERFFQNFSTDTADTHGIVYTPEPIVKWMVSSVEEVLKAEFGKTLSDQGVHILDPCVGTGTFMLELMERIRPSALPHKYREELHCNEVLLLPYYIAAQNIEHEFYERTEAYEPFPGICFADTLDMGREQVSMFALENTERLHRQETAPIRVIIGNPPYNVGQQNENDNNKNRKYAATGRGKMSREGVDDRIRATYVKESRATLNAQLYDMYVRFFRWATDRLRGDDGVVCFVSNNSFLDQITFDGMRKDLLREFTHIYVLDLGGNVRKNPKLSGTTHNVFGIQIGVAITILVRHRADERRNGVAEVYYARVGESWKRRQKYDFLDSRADVRGVEWQLLTPNDRGTWLTQGIEEGFTVFPAIGASAKGRKNARHDAIFSVYSGSVKTNRDDWVYGFNPVALSERIQQFIRTFNAEILRWSHAARPASEIDSFVLADDTKIKWSEHLKRALVRGTMIAFDEARIRRALTRPFTRASFYFDPILNDRPGLFDRILPTFQSEHENVAICVSGIGHRAPFTVIAACLLPNYTLNSVDGFQCFPFYVYDTDGTQRRENVTDWALEEYQQRYGPDVTKPDIFHYVYGILHSPEYRTRYAENLKRDLPHVPFVSPDAFRAFVGAGRALADLHVGYESAAEYPLEHVERSPFSWRVERMKLSPDRTQLVYNESLTLRGIPPEVFDYRLGNRSALEWVVDQYRVKTDARSGITHDPNNPQDEQYIVRLIKQVVTVSLETVRIVNGLPPLEIVS